jgi:hypothetical protein
VSGAAAATAPVAASGRKEMPGKIVFGVLLAHLAVTMLTLGSRIPGFGVIHPTLTFVAIIWGWWFWVGLRSEVSSGIDTPWGRRLAILMIVSIASLPFTKYPGSVLHEGLPTLIRVASFVYFCMFLCTTWKRLCVFVWVWVGCQIFRVMQPVVMHVTMGYWGDSAYMGEGDFLNRLAGAPGDIVNPNGLGFIVASVLPFLHYLVMNQPRKWLLKLAYLAVLGGMVYGLVLTGSRSAMLALGIDVMMIAWRSRHRVLVFSLIGITAAISVNFMSADLIDRYESLVSNNTRNASTRQGRVAGAIEDFEFGLTRPVFGYGLGTSHEANWNIKHDRFISHDMYAETTIELGLVGLGILLSYLASIVAAVDGSRKFMARAPPTADGYVFLNALNLALRVWVPMALIFFFAQYGLREPDWYLMGGISGALYMLARKAAESGDTDAALPAASAPTRPIRRTGGRQLRPLASRPPYKKLT